MFPEGDVMYIVLLVRAGAKNVVALLTGIRREDAEVLETDNE